MDREGSGGSIDGRIERAKDAALGPHDGQPTVADLVGEAAGGITGVLAGAAIGSLAGPVGTVIGGIAGAIGGWWGGRAISEAVEKLTEDDETYYRQHYHSSPARPADRSFDEARPAYHLGHIAGMNPEYKGRRFEEIEEDLQRGWNDDVRNRYGEWDAVRGFVEAGFNRRVGTPDDVSARTGESTPAEAARDRTDKPAGRSSASEHRSIPRGTDEESPRP
ncbi:MAG: hypothetical protein ABR499_21245 [Gemmatimonadaceae bacterium]